jgi:stress response protein YsnF
VIEINGGFTKEKKEMTIISIAEEVLVVEKRWMLREEIHIRTQRIETHQPQRITLRSEEVQVEHVPQADAQSALRADSEDISPVLRG